MYRVMEKCLLKNIGNESDIFTLLEDHSSKLRSSMVKSLSVFDVLKDTSRIALYAELLNLIDSLNLRTMGCSANGMFLISSMGSWMLLMRMESDSMESSSQALQIGVHTSGSEGDACSLGMMGVVVCGWAWDRVWNRTVSGCWWAEVGEDWLEQETPP